ncbi:MAG: serine hydrolase domain-containing protein, partial [Candidatus Latescibacteria bacterium]|nr:serine hydrolase domain-containing protein [Candidatus Latescibacterota bacterium]
MDSAISGAMSDAIDREWIPGGVTLVWHDGALLHRAAHGFSQISPNREKANVETVYDLASLTKPVVTATIAMSLIARGQLALEDPVSRHIGEYVGDGRDDVTINHLLLHTSGLSAFGADQAKKVVDRQSAKDILCSSRNLARPPGELFEYTDLGPILLGFVIETITGEPLERAAKRIIFGPLGMSDTRFCPKDLSRIAPTEEMNGVMLRGTAHDPICRAMGGVAGHAGLFGTADDLLKYAMMI